MRKILIIMGILSLTSCVITFPGTRYKHLTEDQKKRVVVCNAAWQAVETLHSEIHIWETITPYFEKRNIHFYVNCCGFHIVEFWNKHHHGPVVPEEESGDWSEDDEMFVFRKLMDSSNK